jgi:UDP-N-acetylglucosamine 2-epimerase (non-hydrolysing)
MRQRSVAVVFGTRPEAVKLAPVVSALGPAARTIHTGQHYDRALAADLLDEVGLAEPDLQLDIGGASRAGQIARALDLLDQAFTETPPELVVVQGDTNTTLAGALAANAHQIPLVHVEAGLRSYDRAMPEEHNRVVADHLADLCCAPTDSSRARLAAEGITGVRVIVTGNTVVDAALRALPDETQRTKLLEQHGLARHGFVLSTFHRPENVDDPRVFRSILSELAALALPVVLPLHPRGVARAEAAGLLDLPGSLRIVPPVGYPEFLGLARECAFLVSDSGGVQEEASIVKRPVLVVRVSTERPEVLGTFAELVAAGPAVGERSRELVANLDTVHAQLETTPTPYGDGHAGERIAAAISAFLPTT